MRGTGSYSSPSRYGSFGYGGYVGTLISAHGSYSFYRLRGLLRHIHINVRGDCISGISGSSTLFNGGVSIRPDIYGLGLGYIYFDGSYSTKSDAVDSSLVRGEGGPFTGILGFVGILSGKGTSNYFQTISLV